MILAEKPAVTSEQILLFYRTQTKEIPGRPNLELPRLMLVLVIFHFPDKTFRGYFGKMFNAVKAGKMSPLRMPEIYFPTIT